MKYWMAYQLERWTATLDAWRYWWRKQEDR